MTTFPKAGLAVITGASSGIGAVYADRLAKQDLPLLLIARRMDRLRALAEALQTKYRVPVEVMSADLVKGDDLARVETRLEREQISVLVNNAGVGGLGPTAKASREKMEDVVKLDVVALMRLTHAALVGFRERDEGVLINIGSVIAFAPSAGGAVYAGSKAFVMNFTRSLQMEYAKTPIRIQLVMPGPVRTEFFSSQGMSDSIFPDCAFLSAEQLVDAAMADLHSGQVVSTPAIADPQTWTNLETARTDYLAANMSGRLGPRYSIL